MTFDLLQVVSYNPFEAYISTILISIGFCLGFDTPNCRNKDTEQHEDSQVKTRVLQYEEKIATTDGSRPLLQKLPNEGISGQTLFKTTSS